MGFTWEMWLAVGALVLLPFLFMGPVFFTSADEPLFRILWRRLRATLERTGMPSAADSDARPDPSERPGGDGSSSTRGDGPTSAGP